MLLLLDCSVVLFVALAFAFASVVVFVGGFCASACFFASRAKRLHSASFWFLAVAGFVFGTSEVTRSGVAGTTVSSGIVSSVCVAIMYMYMLQVKFDFRLILI